MGASDVRWNSATTSALHRAYHFYTTNTASGIEFAFPRLDKCDGTEPSISELINVGESGWIDLSPNRFVANLYNGVTYNGSNLGSFVFDGSTGYSDIPLTSYTPYCVDIWFNNHDDITSAAMQGNYQ